MKAAFAPTNRPLYLRLPSGPTLCKFLEWLSIFIHGSSEFSDHEAMPSMGAACVFNGMPIPPTLNLLHLRQVWEQVRDEVLE